MKFKRGDKVIIKNIPLEGNTDISMKKRFINKTGRLMQIINEGSTALYYIKLDNKNLNIYYHYGGCLAVYDAELEKSELENQFLIPM